MGILKTLYEKYILKEEKEQKQYTVNYVHEWEEQKLYKNILWAIGKPYTQDQLVRAAIVTSHLLIKKKGRNGHNLRQYMRKRLLNSSGLQFHMKIE